MKGYRFLGWYDQLTEERFDSQKPVTENVQLVAGWEPVETDKTETGFKGRILNLYREWDEAVGIVIIFLSVLFCAVLCLMIFLVHRQNRAAGKNRRAK